MPPLETTTSGRVKDLFVSSQSLIPTRSSRPLNSGLFLLSLERFANFYTLKFGLHILLLNLLALGFRRFHEHLAIDRIMPFSAAC